MKTLLLLVVIGTVLLGAGSGICEYRPRIRIVEIMRDPAGVPDGYGEWFEIYNDRWHPGSLQGYTFVDADGDSFTITEDITIGHHELFVIGASTDPLLNGNAHVDYQWSNFSLDDDADEIIVHLDGHVFDSVAYSWPSWPSLDGHSIYYDPWSCDPEFPQDCWELEEYYAYGPPGNFGTPGGFGGVVHRTEGAWSEIKALYR